METELNMKVVILCGGRGTRLAEETKIIPKPLVKVGNKPILLHIINYYKKFGIKNFIIATGYKGILIKKYFEKKQFKKLNIQIIDTGLNTLTGGRLLRLKKYLFDQQNFMLTYGDGLSDVDLNKSLKFHLRHKKVATLTAVRPPVRFGELSLKVNDVTQFREKLQSKSGWINGGYFIFNKKIFLYLKKDSEMLEKEPMSLLVKKKKLSAYKHSGFWQCMDTMRDKKYLNDILKRKKLNGFKIKKFYKNKRILITGVTGFKGAWLALWLKLLGSKVTGIGYSPNNNKNS